MNCTTFKPMQTEYTKTLLSLNVPFERFSVQETVLERGGAMYLAQKHFSRIAYVGQKKLRYWPSQCTCCPGPALVPAISRPLLSTHQHLFPTALHWTDWNCPSSRHVGTCTLSLFLLSIPILCSAISAATWHATDQQTQGRACASITYLIMAYTDARARSSTYRSPSLLSYTQCRSHWSSICHRRNNQSRTSIRNRTMLPNGKFCKGIALVSLLHLNVLKTIDQFPEINFRREKDNNGQIMDK